MNKMKKVLSVILTAIMVLAMSIPTFAASKGADNIYGTADDRGTITIKGIDEETGIEVKAYPIIEAVYGDNGSFSGYKSLYTVSEITKDQVVNSDITLSAAQLTEYANKVTGTSHTMTKDSNGNYVAEVPVGAYIVLVTKTEAHSYNPMVVSVTYTNNNGSTDITDGNLDITDGEAVAKKSDAPEVDKKITNANKDANASDKGHSVNIGDDVNYEVSVNPIPNYTGDHPVLNVVDTLSTGLTYNNDLVVKIDETTLTKNVDYTVEFDKAKNEITVNFVVGGKYTLNAYQGKAAVITYSAKLNKDAALNNLANTNDVTLNYTKDSKTTGNEDDDNSKTYTYTFDIDGAATGTTGIITKTGVENETETALNGAEFGLYTSKEDAKNNMNSVATQKSKKEGDVDGQLHFTGLKAGTYYLKEISAPAPYSVNNNIYTVVITAEYYTEANAEQNIDKGMLKKWTVTIDDNEVASFEATHSWSKTGEGTTIKNTKISSLPSTGGIGTTIFTIGGCAIMIVAAGLFFATRRKTQK